jgi:hypothetical protein
LVQCALVSLIAGLVAGALDLAGVAGLLSQSVWILPVMGVVLPWYRYRGGAPHLSPEGCERRLKSLEGWKGGSHEHHQEMVYNGGIARLCSSRWIGTIRDGRDCLWYRNGGRDRRRKWRSDWGRCRRRQEGGTNRYRRWSRRRCHLRCDSISRRVLAAEGCWLCHSPRLPQSLSRRRYADSAGYLSLSVTVPSV